MTMLQPSMQRQVDAGIDALDIMHGQLKLDMLHAEDNYMASKKIEEDNDYSDAMESMDRKYDEGFLDALTYVYQMTYDLGFAIADKKAGK